MPDFLNDLPETINKILDILELIVVRTTILGLAIVGACTIFKRQ